VLEDSHDIEMLIVTTASPSSIDIERPELAIHGSALDRLLAEGRCGSREAQQRLYECFHRRVYRLLIRMVGRDDAEDLLQQVFLQVFRTLNQFQGQSRFETWLYRVSVNESLQHLRKQRSRRSVSLESDIMDRKLDPVLDFDQKELMEYALARLEPELRSLFLLREVEKQSYAEIAGALQIPEGTVASRLGRARQCLKQYLVELGWEP
jgi:RNA polymerase sigma-70 factor (ECF subfamily)